jgi:hypothetical protein
VALGLAALAQAQVKEMVGGELPSDYLNNAEFNVVSFYDSSEDSQYFNKVFSEAMHYINEKLATDKWHHRQIQWVQADIGAYPELAFDDRGPTQIVYANDIKMSQRVDWTRNPTISLE